MTQLWPPAPAQPTFVRDAASSFRLMPLPDPHPDHHLWRNGRLWWAAFTVVHADGRKRRLRRSLRTPDLGEARRRRDALLQQVRRYPGWRPYLRLCPRRGAGAAAASGDRMSPGAP